MQCRETSREQSGNRERDRRDRKEEKLIDKEKKDRGQVIITNIDSSHFTAIWTAANCCSQ